MKDLLGSEHCAGKVECGAVYGPMDMRARFEKDRCC